MIVHVVDRELRMTNLRLEGGRLAYYKVDGAVVGATYRIEVSVDLKNWEPHPRNTNFKAPGEIFTAGFYELGDLSQRFFRLMRE